MRLSAVILAFLLLTQPLCAKTDYKKWLEQEVVWIISKKEREAFRALKSDQAREEFIRRFWERRDQTPSTPRNEYKEEHYRRYEFALKHFQEGIPGWKTDRGRIYILRGPPDREYFHTSDSRLDIDNQQPDTNVRARMPNTIIWTYHENPDAKFYRGEIVLVFQPSTGITRQTFVLGESGTAQEKADEKARLFGPVADQTWLESDVRYRLIVAGPPSLVNPSGAETPNVGSGEMTRYLEDLLRSPGDILEERLARAEALEETKRQLREAVTTKLSFGNLHMELSSQSFRRPDGNYSVGVQIDIPRDELSQYLSDSKSARKTSGVDLYCAILDASDRVADEFIDYLEVTPSNLASLSARNLHYLNSFVVPKGDYTLKAALRTSGMERIGFLESTVLLSPRQGPELTMSEVMLTNHVQAAESAGSASRRSAPTMRDTQFIPNPSHEFSTGDSLIAYFQIYLPQGAELQDSTVSVAASFIAGNGIVKRLDPRRITESNSDQPGVINYATAVPLGEFQAGDYSMQVQVIEHNSRKFAIRRASFTVVAPK
jgi:GWxTD domain-containing protein